MSTSVHIKQHFTSKVTQKYINYVFIVIFNMLVIKAAESSKNFQTVKHMVSQDNGGDGEPKKTNNILENSSPKHFI